MNRKVPGSTGRRTVLRTAGLAATGGIAGLAGCLSEGAGDDTATSGDESTPDGSATPGAAAFAFDEWLPAASAFDSDYYGFGVMEPSSLAGYASALGEEYSDRLVAGGFLTDATGVDAAEAGTFVAVSGVLVLRTAFESEAVATSLGDAGFERSGSHGGVDFWSGATGSEYEGHTVGVGDGVLLGARRGSTESLKTVVDAGGGEAARLGTEDDTAATLLGELESGQLRVGNLREPPTETNTEYAQFAGNSALGYRVSLGAPDTTVHIAFVFESADAADAEAVRTWLDGTDSGPGQLEDTTVEADGTLVTADGTLPTADLPDSGLGSYFVSAGGSSGSDSASGRGTAEPIRAGATVEVDSDTDTVTVTWTSNADADYLTATFEPAGGSAVEKRLDDIGDSVSYEGQDGAEVTVTVRAHAGDGSLVILQKVTEL